MYYIGIDVGSTCTKAAVLNEEKELVFHQVLPTGWDCVETAETLLRSMEAAGISRAESRCVATGYGRVSVPFADKAVTEITCHGKGAAWLFGDGRLTVIDIGGQDTKIIEIAGGQVRNFMMNDKCSAGTGRFLDVMSTAMGLKLNDLCELARESTNHITISSMCTVFAESEVVSLIGKGAARADIAYGIVDSIAGKVKSQLGKVSTSGDSICLTGGLCEIPFILELLSRRLGSEVRSHPLARYAGAIGAAIAAMSLR